MKKVKVTKADTLRIAGEASCDPRTVERYLAESPVRALVAERIEAAMKKLKVQSERCG